MDLLTAAKKIADRVEAESLKQNVPVAVTVIDTHGNVVLIHRMTGAPAFSLELSERKAYTSALVGIRTATPAPRVPPRGQLPLAVAGGGWSAAVGEGPGPRTRTSPPPAAGDRGGTKGRAVPSSKGR